MDKQVIELEDNSSVEVYRGFYSVEEANTVLEAVKAETDWKQEKTRWGTNVPRLNAWCSDENLSYSYSGISHVGAGWTPMCEKVKNKVQSVSGYEFNSLLLNYYRNGGDSIGRHTDAEKPLGKNPIVASVSFGATRKFILRHMKKKTEDGQRLAKTLYLEHGSLLVMAGELQHHWTHEMPKEEGIDEERISLTFRLIKLDELGIV